MFIEIYSFAVNDGEGTHVGNDGTLWNNRGGRKAQASEIAPNLREE